MIFVYGIRGGDVEMRRVEKSKKQLVETLHRQLELNPQEAWDQTFLIFQELMNDLPTYGEKLQFVKYYNDLLKNRTSNKAKKKIANI